MFSKIARIAVLLIFAVMIAAWAMSVGKSETSKQGGEEPVWIVWA